VQQANRNLDDIAQAAHQSRGCDLFLVAIASLAVITPAPAEYPSIVRESAIMVHAKGKARDPLQTWHRERNVLGRIQGAAIAKLTPIILAPASERSIAQPRTGMIPPYFNL
jgi:hypothetical protein